MLPTRSAIRRTLPTTATGQPGSAAASSARSALGQRPRPQQRHAPPAVLDYLDPPHDGLLQPRDRWRADYGGVLWRLPQ